MVESYDCIMRSFSDNSEVESSFTSDDSIYCINQATEAVHLMINQTPKKTREQEELATKLLKLGPIGLSLDISSSLTSFIEKNLIDTNRSYHPLHRTMNATKFKDFEHQQAEKLKASSCAATSLRIGTWQRESMNESDLTAKCYFAKRRLVWELLEGGLKKKIELLWSDIVGLQGIIKENEPGQLKIELSNPPAFYQEINPQPRKHTSWQPTTDFTGGQASICRRHYLWFLPGILDSGFEKLIQSDDWLLRLSKQQFPSQPPSPYFQTDIYGSNSISFGEQYPGFTLTNFVHPPQLRISEQTIIESFVQKDSSSPISVMNFPNIDARSSNFIVNNSSLPPFWSQATNQFAESSVRDHRSEFAENSVRDYGVITSPNYNLPNYGEMVTETFNSTDQILSEIEQSLFGDLQEGENYVKRVASFSSLINTSFQENSLTYENQQRPANDNRVLLNTMQHSNVAVTAYVQQAASSRVALQGLNFDPAMYTQIYAHPSMFLDPPPEDVDTGRNNENFMWIPGGHQR